MLGKCRALLLVELHFLRLPTLQRASHCYRVAAVVKHILAIDCKIVGTHTNVLAVHRIEVTLAKRQIIQRIQQIGLSHTVIADQTIHVVRERNI